ncbi:phage antirepressor [Apilactobacillus xinyiensis]|uniref:phage antirepressor n=1 Tax=Apilactobacillus xinyiensis TaxID=2841032 RepID=UPI00200E68C8|nr:phage antirepressor [Apilactobacillus xinyiensis]MCL0330665.1 phage antirepressor [Apilactobacillus xinyiensis]
MKNEMELFNFEGNQVRTLLISGTPYFVGKDVATVLGYSNSSKAVNVHVDAEDKIKRQIPTSQNGHLVSNTNLINESGLYSLILSSKLPKAKKFKRWVTNEVLPEIRRNGSYQSEPKQPSNVVELLQDPDNLLKLVTNYKKVSDENKTMKPKAIFADAVSASHSTILVGDLAKLLKQNGVNIGATRLFRWLRENGYLIRRKGSDYNTPTQRSMEMKLFRTKETSITHSDGHTTVNKTPKVTGKGQQYFINKFLKLSDIDISGQLPTELEG